MRTADARFRKIHATGFAAANIFNAWRPCILGAAFYLSASASAMAQENFNVVDLGALAPGAPSVAFSISDDGNVVGYYLFNGSLHAALWQNATKLIRLDPLGRIVSRSA
jgi:probable HAF family extracellular repeat protein